MFNWSEVQKEDGKTILLYRHQRIFDEGIVYGKCKVLDIGGWGVLASRIIEEGSTCVILDNFSEDQYFPSRVKELPHIVGDILDTDKLPLWEAGTYDVVTCFEMLEHCKDQVLGVSNMYKMLKNDGSIVGTFPLPGFCHNLGEDDITFLDRADLKTLLEKSGFSDVTVEPTGSVAKGDEPCSLYFTGKKRSV